MGMELKVEKVVTEEGKKMYKLITFVALSKDKLPKMYTNSYPSVWSNPECNILSAIIAVRKQTSDKNCIVTSYLRSGELLTEEEFQELLKHLEKSGTRLMEINQKLREMREDWCGEEIHHF
jgi:tRNA A22 N-methylase